VVVAVWRATRSPTATRNDPLDGGAVPIALALATGAPLDGGAVQRLFMTQRIDAPIFLADPEILKGEDE
jgi:hypothetical protein